MAIKIWRIPRGWKDGLRTHLTVPDHRCHRSPARGLLCRETCKVEVMTMEKWVLRQVRKDYERRGLSLDEEFYAASVPLDYAATAEEIVYELYADREMAHKYLVTHTPQAAAESE